MNNSQKDQEIRQWAMFLHFSLLAVFVIPPVGLVAPIIIWQVKKDDLPEINTHGKIVVNWLISAFIYVVCLIVLFVLFSVFFHLILMHLNEDISMIVFPISTIIPTIFWLIFFILTFIFPIIGGIKASNGKVWRYPLSLRILK